MSIQTRSICHLLLKTLLATMPPVIIFVVFFIVVDPFKVTRTYGFDEYFPDPDIVSARVSINKGIVSLEAFKHNLMMGDTCNSFIFGSSISVYYDVDSWRKKLDDNGSVKAMHFDSSSESIYSLARKVEYLDSKVKDIRNALIVFDPIVMQGEENDSPYAIDPPELHPDDPFFRLRFLYTFFRASTNADFFKNWIPYILDGKVHNNGHNQLFEPQPIIYDSAINQESLPTFDCLIRLDPISFYSMFPLVKSPEEPSVSPIVLHAAKRGALEKIAEIFKRHETNYKIIVGPNRRKVILNPADYQTLVDVFGAGNVFDYSLNLVNRLETDTLLYDNTHYRAPFASEMLDLTYGH